MSKKDFSNLLLPATPAKASKYNHYKPFHDPRDVPQHTVIVNEEDNKHSPHQVKDVETERKLDTNRTQSGNKVATNRQQTDNATDNKVATNRQQTGNKKISDKETGNKVGTQLATLSATNRQQTGNKLATNREQSGGQTGNRTDNKLS